MRSWENISFKITLWRRVVQPLNYASISKFVHIIWLHHVLITRGKMLWGLNVKDITLFTGIQFNPVIIKLAYVSIFSYLY